MFKSFYSAGFEATASYNQNRDYIHSIQATQHDRFLEEDYARLAEIGIFTIREALNWNEVYAGSRFNPEPLDRILSAARRYEIELILDLFHYDYPQDLDIMGEEFIDRFAEYCYKVAKHVAANLEGTPFFTPVNEPSFYSWAAGSASLFRPYLDDLGYELKVQLIRAAIAGIDGIRTVLPEARIVNADPLTKVAAPQDRPDLQEIVEEFNSVWRFESWDILAGLALPELGGSRAHLDIVGINYYAVNQWEFGFRDRALTPDDPRYVPLHQLVQEVYERYRGDLMISETSHVGDWRPGWLELIENEVDLLLEKGVPLAGVCLYPVLSMPKWQNPEEWQHMGLWDLVHEDGVLHRETNLPFMQAFEQARGKRAAGN